MNRALAKAITDLRKSLTETSTDPVQVSLKLPTDAAQKVLTLLQVENNGGALILRGSDEFSPAEASVLLGFSRPTVMARIEDGTLAARRSGSRWVITAAAIVAYQERLDESRASRDRDIAALATGVAFPSPVARGSHNNAEPT